jgi:hypothetical protein
MLSHLKSQARQLDAIHQRILAQLPATLRKHCHHVYWSGSTLIIQISSSAALGKIRQMQGRLLSALQEDKIPVTEIKPVMAVPEYRPAIVKSFKMTPVAQRTLSNIAEHVNDTSLKKAITTLIKKHAGL